jgi:P27 family predicted phage terminase small subunit
MKGRKPKPKAIHLLQGNRSHLTKKELSDRGEPEPPRGIPQAPEQLSKEAKIAWPLLAARLDEMGVLTYADAWALEQLAENYAEILSWRKEIKKNGRMMNYTNKFGEESERINPACLALSDTEKRFRAMMAEFGLTPSSRMRLHAIPKEKKESNPAAKYFARGKVVPIRSGN